MTVKNDRQARAVELGQRLKESVAQLAIGGFNKLQKNRIKLAHSQNMLSRDQLTQKIKKTQETRINSRDHNFRSDLESIEHSIKNNGKYFNGSRSTIVR